MQYMSTSAGNMGPNAMPVPEFYAARIPVSHYITSGFEAHTMKGDQTINAYTEYNFPLFTDRASVQIIYRPIEYYQTDTIIRNARRARTLDTDGYSLGDVYLSTYIQAIKDHRFLPDLLLSMNFKTASGTNFESGRHTDTPGYYVDATLGRSFYLREDAIIKQIRPYGKIGFYAWQNLTYLYPQNDAILYGIGIELSGKSFSIQNQISGYKGYLDNGDRPVVYRLELETVREKRGNFCVRWQQGLKDIEYGSLRVVWKWRLGS